MGLITGIKRLFRGFGIVVSRALFLWWLSVIVIVDVLLLAYHMLISNGMYPPMALLFLEIAAFVPISVLAIMFGGRKKNDRLRNKDGQVNKRKNYAGLESRARI